ncbi:unnamed protein product [Laminaria digitata]
MTLCDAVGAVAGASPLPPFAAAVGLKARVVLLLASPGALAVGGSPFLAEAATPAVVVAEAAAARDEQVRALSSWVLKAARDAVRAEQAASYSRVLVDDRPLDKTGRRAYVDGRSAAGEAHAAVDVTLGALTLVGTLASGAARDTGGAGSRRASPSTGPKALAAPAAGAVDKPARLGMPQAVLALATAAERLGRPPLVGSGTRGGGEGGDGRTGLWGAAVASVLALLRLNSAAVLMANGSGGSILLTALSSALRSSELLKTEPPIDEAGNPEARGWAARTAACMLAASLPLPVATNATLVAATATAAAAPNNTPDTQEGGRLEGTRLAQGQVDDGRDAAGRSCCAGHSDAAGVERAVWVCLRALEAVPPGLAREERVARFVGDVGGALRELVGGGAGFRNCGDDPGSSFGIGGAEPPSPGGFVSPRGMSLSSPARGGGKRRRHGGDEEKVTGGGGGEGGDGDDMVESPPPPRGGDPAGGSSSGQKKKKNSKGSGKVSTTKKRAKNRV